MATDNVKLDLLKQAEATRKRAVMNDLLAKKLADDARKRQRRDNLLSMKLSGGDKVAAREAKRALKKHHVPGNPFVEHEPGNPFVEQPAKAENAFSAGTDAFARTFLNNVMALPSSALAGAAALPRLLPGGQTFSEGFEEELGKFPASAIRPTVEGTAASVRALPALAPGGPTFGEQKAFERAEIQAEDIRRRAKFPKASFAGDIAGDVATIVGGRLPFAGKINKGETRLFGKGPDLLFGGALKAPKLADPGVARLAQRVITSRPIKLLARGTGRSLEAGFEAAALDLLKGEDPLETAAYAAGVQMAGSGLLQTGKGLLTGGPMKASAKLLLAGASFGAVYQIAKETVPGGEDNLINSIEVGFEKVQLAMVLGLIAGLSGSGRLRGGKLAEDLPRLTDALATAPRAAMISLLEDFANPEVGPGGE